MIGGINVYIYGLSRISKLTDSDSLCVLYLAHARCGVYQDCEKLAHLWLNHYYQHKAEKDIHLIAVTFDLRNHGTRIVDPKFNEDWAAGNDAHSLDMTTIIQGSAEDFKLVIEYLPLYLPHYFEHINPGKHLNIVSGVSLGGHVTWRVAGMVPDKVSAIAPIIGTPNLSLLYFDRLNKQVKNDSGFNVELPAGNVPKPYDELASGLSPEQRLRYPRAIYEHISQQDQSVSNLPDGMAIFIAVGAKDNLVPPAITHEWYHSNLKRNFLEIFEQPETGHELTKEMCAAVADWLVSAVGRLA